MLWRGIVSALVVPAVLLCGCGDDGGAPLPPALPDLVAESANPDASSEVVPGNGFAIRRNITVDNGLPESGEKAPGDVGPFKVRYYFSTNDVLDVVTDIEMAPAEEFGVIPAGDSIPFGDWVVEVPLTMAENSYYCFMVVDSDDEVAESDETNNVAGTTGSPAIDVVAGPGQKPDLFVQMVVYSSTLTHDTSTSVSVGVANNGPVECGSASVARLYLSVDTAVGTGDELLSSDLAVNDLAAGEEQPFEIDFTVPDTITGAAWLLLDIDVNGVVDETVEGSVQVGSVTVSVP